VVVHAPVVSPDRLDLLARLRRAGTRFVGMTSDADFPASQWGAGGGLLDYGQLCEAWCHCFREPDRYLPPELPRALISASDFTNRVSVRQQAAAGAAAWGVRRFDFVHAGAAPAWKREVKGWPLARRCLPVLCGHLGLRGLLVGVPPELVPPLPRLTVVPELPWPTFLAAVAGCRFLFAPNGPDASPRVLAEALCLDVPILVHRRILGGWKYVTPWTGVFFDDECDVAAAAGACLAGAWRPSTDFRRTHGPYLAGRRLLALLRTLDPSINERSHLRLERQRVSLGPTA
jgi:hypothetical protein